MDKTFWQEALKQFGVGIVFAVMLAIFYTNENAKWEKNAANDQVRWESVLKQYSDDQKRALETIRACCAENHATPGRKP